LIIVLDANLIASLVLPLPYSRVAAAQILEWKRHSFTLAAPSLWCYEVSTILRKALAAGYLKADQLDNALMKIWQIHIEDVAPTLDLQKKAIVWAERLGHSKTYDASYLAAAESLLAEFWTADQRLAHAANQAGAAWTHSVFENQ